MKFHPLSLTVTLPFLAACNSGMMALAPSVPALQAPGIPVQIVRVDAGAADVAARYSNVLAREAAARGYAVQPANGAGQAIRLKAYLTAYGTDNGQTAFSWVLDTSEDGQRRTGRVSGQNVLAISSAGGWTSLDEATMRKVAGASLDALTLQLTNPEAAIAARQAASETQQDQ